MIATIFTSFRLSLLLLVALGFYGCASQVRCEDYPDGRHGGAGGETPSSDTSEHVAGETAHQAGFVRAAAEVEQRVAPHGKAQIDLLARGENAFVGRLEMVPNAAVPEHQDPTEEYIYVLEGTGTMTMDGQTFEVGPGSIIFMPAFAKVSFQNGPTKMVAVQVFAGPAPADKYNMWNAPAE